MFGGKMLNKDYVTYMPRTRGVTEEEAFFAWIEAGSLARASKMLAEQGKINRSTGKPYSTIGLNISAKRFIALENEKAKPVMLNLWRQAGVELSDEEWEEFVVHAAVQSMGRFSLNRFVRWLEANPFAKKYEHIYINRVPGIDTVEI